MALMYSSKTPDLWVAKDFSLPGVDGKEYSLADFRDRKALVLVFLCNHCPYVVAVQDRINQIAKDYASRGVALIGINPNDATRYPDDSMQKMKERAASEGYAFPYLQDESQEVARAYDAVCTPDPYVFERFDLPGEAFEFRLRYRGRIDDSWKDEGAVKTRDLRAALDAILEKRPVAAEQIPSMGCSIKWKAPLSG